MVRNSFLALSLVLVVGAPVLAQENPKEPLVDQVKSSIDRGVRYLRQQQRPNGSWEGANGLIGGLQFTQGGQTCLALLAMLNSGVAPNDPAVQAGLEWLRKLPPQGTYVVGLQTMVLAEARQPKDKQQIATNVDWLLKAQVIQGGRLIGWGYGAGGPGADFSNSQYALLGLHAGKQAGVKIPDNVWTTIQNFYMASQIAGPGPNRGGWGYTFNDRFPRMTMTCAGLCGLYICGSEAKEGEQKLNKQTGVAARCGQYADNDAITAALNWLASNFTFRLGQHEFYNIYGIERTGRLSGLRMLAGRDWYREGCEYLIKLQTDDGSWQGRGIDGSSVISSSFALLFLSKGRTPILISKMAWGRADEWNNKHHDMKYVVEYASKNLFKDLPLGWQIFDARKMDGTNRQKVLEEVGDLLNCPILFINGHEKPNLTDLQKQILKQYIEEGGFVLAEACCGREAFAQGFRDLMKELFDKEMTPLPADHGIYRAHRVISDPSIFPLERLDLGCKTVVVLSPKPLSGWWEENDQKSAKGELAFWLAGNIVAYATNMEPPQPRLHRVTVLDTKEEAKLPRGFFKVAQIRHEGDWQPAPNAMKNLMAYLREEAKLDVALQTEAVGITSDKLKDFHFLYMHGRRKFQFADEDLKKLKWVLSPRNGGVLLADACCGSKEFDAAFREFARKLFDAPLEPIPATDYLYSKELNGTAITSVKCRLPKLGGGTPELQDISPMLLGIKQKGRWVVIYSPYDLGCALEKRPSSDCIGHDHESALRLAGAAVLYYLNPK
ncbi:MAG TPA: DUF4159 domain-containing protein [Gemmataceae bacterium]|nr:DUF4159 domain-containing protein [Gemmataceae bacterium]